MTEILQQLRDQLKAATERRNSAAADCAKLGAAIAALEGKAPAPVGNGSVAPKPPTVVSLVEEAVMALPAGATFDKPSIRIKAQTLFPRQAERISTGVYGAVDTLLKLKKIKLAPGGYQLNTEIAPPKGTHL